MAKIVIDENGNIRTPTLEEMRPSAGSAANKPKEHTGQVSRSMPPRQPAASQQRSGFNPNAFSAPVPPPSKRSTVPPRPTPPTMNTVDKPKGNDIVVNKNTISAVSAPKKESEEIKMEEKETVKVMPEVMPQAESAAVESAVQPNEKTEAVVEEPKVVEPTATVAHEPEVATTEMHEMELATATNQATAVSAMNNVGSESLVRNCVLKAIRETAKHGGSSFQVSADPKIVLMGLRINGDEYVVTFATEQGIVIVGYKRKTGAVRDMASKIRFEGDEVYCDDAFVSTKSAIEKAVKA